MRIMPGEKLANCQNYQRRSKGRKKERKKPRINRHHMTNRCKGGKDTENNILYMKVDRHAALHKMFRNMSWEEIGDALKAIFGVRDPHKCITVIERISRLKGRVA